MGQEAGTGAVEYPRVDVGAVVGRWDIGDGELAIVSGHRVVSQRRITGPARVEGADGHAHGGGAGAGVLDAATDNAVRGGGGAADGVLDGLRHARINHAVAAEAFGLLEGQHGLIRGLAEILELTLGQVDVVVEATQCPVESPDVAPTTAQRDAKVLQQHDRVEIPHEPLFAATPEKGGPDDARRARSGLCLSSSGQVRPADAANMAAYYTRLHWTKQEFSSKLR